MSLIFCLFTVSILFVSILLHFENIVINMPTEKVINFSVSKYRLRFLWILIFYLEQCLNIEIPRLLIKDGMEGGKGPSVLNYLFALEPLLLIQYFFAHYSRFFNCLVHFSLFFMFTLRPLCSILNTPSRPLETFMDNRI